MNSGPVQRSHYLKQKKKRHRYLRLRKLVILRSSKSADLVRQKKVGKAKAKICNLLRRHVYKSDDL